MELTIIVCTYNRYEKLSKLLESLNNQSFKNFSVLVVDASSTKHNINDNEYFYELNFLKATKPNLPLQRWEGAQQCKTKLIGFLDDDVTLESNYLEVIINNFNKQSGISGLSGWFVNIPAPRKSLVKDIRFLLSGINKSKQGAISKGGFAIPYSLKPDKMVQTSFLSGGSMFYKTDIFKSNCHLPWLYDLYSKKQGRAEDLAVSGLLNSLGFKLYYDPSIQFYHYEEGGGSAFARNGFDKGIADSYCRLKVYHLINNKWNLLNWFSFFRYFFINFIVLNIFDLKYQHGLFVGLLRYFRGENE